MQSRYVLIAWCTQQNREFRSRNAKFTHHNFNRNGDAIVMSLQAIVAHYKKPNVSLVSRETALWWKAKIRNVSNAGKMTFGRFCKDSATSVTTARTDLKTGLTKSLFPSSKTLGFKTRPCVKPFLWKWDFALTLDLKQRLEATSRRAVAEQ